MFVFFNKKTNFLPNQRYHDFIIYLRKTDIIRFYLLPKSTVLKLCRQKFEYVAVQKLVYLYTNF